MATDHKGPGHNRDHNFVTEPIVIDRAAFNQGENGKGGSVSQNQVMDPLIAAGPHAVAFKINTNKSHWEGSEVHPTLNRGGEGQIGYSNQELFSQGGCGLVQALYENHPNDSRVTGPHEVAPSCVSRFGTGGGNVPLVQESVPFRDPSPTLTNKMQGQAGWAPYNEDAHLVGVVPLVQEAVAVDTYNQAIQDKAVPIRSTASDVCHTGGVINPKDRMAVRRLTPKECERLQGFPDNHTLIPWRGKPADQCPDGPRYKALGNSMAVPCMAWIGKRIAKAEHERQGAA